MATEASVMWVHPAFKKKLKIEAIQNNKSVLQHTKELATQNDIISKPIAKPLKKTKKGGFEFAF